MGELRALLHEYPRQTWRRESWLDFLDPEGEGKITHRRSKHTDLLFESDPKISDPAINEEPKTADSEIQTPLEASERTVSDDLEDDSFSRITEGEHYHQAEIRKRMADLKPKAAKRRCESAIENFSDHFYVDRDDLFDLLKACTEYIDRERNEHSTPLVSMQQVANAAKEVPAKPQITHQLFAALASVCTPNLSLKRQAQLLSVPDTTYRGHLEVQEPAEAAEEPHCNRGRPRLPHVEDIAPTTDKQGRMLDWVIHNAPVKSGQVNFRVMRQPTLIEAHLRYSNAEAVEGREPLGIGSFRQLMHQWGIHCAGYDKYTCPYCIAEPISEARLDLLSKQLRMHDLHRALLLEGKAGIIIADYCRIHEFPELSVQLPGEEREKLKLSCLGFVFLRADPDVAGSIQATNIDLFSAIQQGQQFFQRGLDTLRDEVSEIIDYDWEYIFFWADGGMETPAHLTCLDAFQQSLMDLAAFEGKDKCPILQSNYYPPYHGHDRCHAHFGRIKGNLRKDIDGAPRNQHSALDAANSLPYRRNAFGHHKMKIRLKQVQLLPDDPIPQQAYIPLTSYKSVLFDPRNPYTILLYPNSLDPLTRDPIRCSLLEEGEPLEPLFVPQNPTEFPWILARKYHDHASLQAHE